MVEPKETKAQKLAKEKAEASSVVEFHNFPLNRLPVTAEAVKVWLRNQGLQEFNTDGSQKWRICNIPTRKKAWLIAGLNLEERNVAYSATDRRRPASP